MGEQSTFERAISHAMELWFEPEIRRRQQLEGAPDPFPLSAAQVILYPDDRANIVRLNQEVRVDGRAELKEGVVKDVGDDVTHDEVQAMSVELPNSEDPDCGHFTLVAVGDRWYGSFDFRYNKGKAAELLEAAREFLATATDAIAAGRRRAAIDNLFSAAELAAKAYVVTMPLPGDGEIKSHGHVHSRFNMFSRHGNVDAGHRDAYNTLVVERGRARYVTGHLAASAHDIARWQADVQGLIDSIADRVA